MFLRQVNLLFELVEIIGVAGQGKGALPAFMRNNSLLLIDRTRIAEPDCNYNDKVDMCFMSR